MAGSLADRCIGWRMAKRAAGMVSGALIGYLFGWIIGWTLFSPDSDIWALLAAIGAVAGLVFGASDGFWVFAEPLCASALGLYAGWLLKILLFGESVEAIGVLVVMAGSFLGWRVGMRLQSMAGPWAAGALFGGLHIGFWGGLVLGVFILDAWLGWIEVHSGLDIAPLVLACGFAGVLIGGWFGQRTGLPKAWMMEHTEEVHLNDRSG